jgi:lipoprotein-anchoring transpeptidase ErfK/SrfK
MRRWIGLLGSWALFVLGFGLISIAVAGEGVNLRDFRRLRRYALVDAMLDESLAGKIEQLRLDRERSESLLKQVRSKLAATDKTIDEAQDTAQTIIVSTAENRVYVRSNHRTVFKAVCSTGKHATLIDGGRTLVFRTPIGKFQVRSKEENPVWIPPDWHYVELARKSGRKVVRLNPGQSIDADTGAAARQTGGGVWDWIGESGGARRVLVVKNNTVVEVSNGIERELPAGAMILAGNTLVIPPFGTPQRKFEKVLGAYRLNLGDGYALHGTQAVNQLGRSVSHGCVRLGDADIAALYKMANVGDEVLIY